MATSKNIKNPPLLSASPSFEQWEKAMKYWQAVTDLPKAKQGPAVTLSLSGKALEAAMELDFDEVSAEDGVVKVMDRLRSIYAKDEVEAAYEAFDNFIHFKRNENSSMAEFITAFELKYSKAKSHGFELSESSQGFFLLNQAGLTEDHRKLVRATISSLSVSEVKNKLTKVFGEGRLGNKLMEDISIKVENINLAEDEDEETYYGYSNIRRGYPGGNSGRAYAHRGTYNQRPYRGFFRGSGKPQYAPRGLSNTSEPRVRRRCSYCESRFHEVNQCPEKIYYNDEYHDSEENQNFNNFDWYRLR